MRLNQINAMTYKKLYTMSEKIRFLPVIYVGNRDIDNYSTNLSKLIIKKQNMLSIHDQYRFIYDPYLYQVLTDNYTLLKVDNKIQENDIKMVTISYRIAHLLMIKTMTEHKTYNNY
jgi:hypothetical protein